MSYAVHAYHDIEEPAFMALPLPVVLSGKVTTIVKLPYIAPKDEPVEPRRVDPSTIPDSQKAMEFGCGWVRRKPRLDELDKDPT